MENTAPLLVNGKPFNGNVIDDRNADVVINDFQPEEVDKGVSIHDFGTYTTSPDGLIKNSRELGIYKKPDLLIIAARKVNIVRNSCSIDIFSAESITIDSNDYEIRIFGVNHDIKVIYSTERLEIYCFYSSIEFQNLCGEVSLLGSNLYIKFTDSGQCCYSSFNIFNSTIEFHKYQGISLTAANSIITFFEEAVPYIEHPSDFYYKGESNRLFIYNPQATQIDDKILRQDNNE